MQLAQLQHPAVRQPARRLQGQAVLRPPQWAQASRHQLRLLQELTVQLLARLSQVQQACRCGRECMRKALCLRLLLALVEAQLQAQAAQLLVQ